MKIIALIETSDPICIETFKDQPAAGRFTLRSNGITVAIGKVTKLISRSEIASAAAAAVESGDAAAPTAAGVEAALSSMSM